MQHKWQHRFGVAAAWMVAVVFVCACSNEGIAFKKAEQSYAIGEYYTASIHYKKSYSRTPPKDKAKRAVRAFKMGECYRRIGYTQKAMAAYANAVRYHVEDSTVYLHLARQQLKAGQYKQAVQNFNQYLEFDPGNELARSGLISCELGPQWKAKPNQYKVKKEAIFNSRRSDYSPMLVGDDADQLVLSSTRKEATGDDISGITGLKFGDLFFSRKNNLHPEYYLRRPPTREVFLFICMYWMPRKSSNNKESHSVKYRSLFLKNSSM